MTHIEFTPSSGGLSATPPTPGAEKAVTVSTGTGKAIACLTGDNAKVKWVIKHGLKTQFVEVAAYTSTGLYKQEVEADKPVAWWRMDEANTAKDVIGGLTAEALGQTVPEVAGALTPGDTDKANEFKAEAANTFTFATTATLELKKELSVECLVKPGAVTTYGIFEKSITETTNTSYLLFLSSGKPLFRVVKAGIKDALALNTLPTTSYSHLVGTFEPLVSKIYLNGTLEAEKAIPAGEITTGAGKSYIGVLAPGTLVPLGGNIDELAIYKTALSSNRVAAHASAVKLGVPSTTEPPVTIKKITVLSSEEIEVELAAAPAAGALAWVTVIG